jgi:taurine--2-oxoglutarate transaminase
MSDFADLQARHVMQCWSAQGNYTPIAVVKTEGCWIHTADGRRLFDLRSAHECINLGFNHPKVLAAMRRQMEQVVYVTDDFATESCARLAERLARLTPGGPGKRVYFAQSGAAAVEAAVKGARLFKYNTVVRGSDTPVDAPAQYPLPYKIIARYRSWHGATAGAASISGDPRRWFQEPFTVPGTVFAPEANAFRCPFGAGVDPTEAGLHYLDYLIEQEGGNNKVAAVIVEPVVGSNGIIPPPPEYLEGVADLCRKWDLLLIADETMTGMGRTGKFLAIEHTGIEPDIVVLGKALGAYCPLTAAVFSERVAAVFQEHIFGHGQSFAGHALGAAAALASLEVLLDDGLLQQAAARGETLGRRLRALGERHPCVGDVRGLGLFWTVEIVRDRRNKTPLRKHTEKYSPTLMRDLAQYLLEERDIYVPGDKFGLWIVPPLIVSEAEIEFLVEGIDAALTQADRWLAPAGGTD